MMDNVETHFMTDTLDRSSQTTLAVSKDIIDEKLLQKNRKFTQYSGRE